MSANSFEIVFQDYVQDIFCKLIFLQLNHYNAFLEVDLNAMVNSFKIKLNTKYLVKMYELFLF